jgi:beta-lactamase superfamily II metal-dependent hydrolase
MTNKPKDTEVEVTLIGTGGGYGESIVLKVSKDSWVIIDSCINPNNKQPLAIEYLNSIGVNLDNVELIICTHWHNDHIKGLSKALELCKKAEFCFSSVHDLDKFLLLCELDYTKSTKGSISSTNEFSQCLKIINDREDAYFVRAQKDLLLLKKKNIEIDFEIFSLSPSPKTIINFDSEISTLITEFGKRNTAVINKTPNDKSVAILLKFNNHRVLLGADLEIGKDDSEGWKHIVKHSKIIDNNKASLYKIPHHGSENGYLEAIFDVLVNNDSVLKLTPYNSSGLPTEDMTNVYLGHSKDLFITSQNHKNKKPKKRDNSIEKVINRSVVSLVEIKFTHGIIRSRIDYASKDSIWNTEVFQSARRIEN